jgi:hypothetical protein
MVIKITKGNTNFNIIREGKQRQSFNTIIANNIQAKVYIYCIFLKGQYTHTNNLYKTTYQNIVNERPAVGRLH